MNANNGIQSVNYSCTKIANICLQKNLAHPHATASFKSTHIGNLLTNTQIFTAKYDHLVRLFSQYWLYVGIGSSPVYYSPATVFSWLDISISRYSTNHVETSSPNIKQNSLEQGVVGQHVDSSVHVMNAQINVRCLVKLSIRLQLFCIALQQCLLGCT